ncbi:MAG: hypothetical protein IKQ46_12795 [Bacteroidales bacterium]|nr:hypothetical protein [Bacteroidales bacterium]
MAKVFDSKYRVNYNDSDYTGKLSLPKLGNYILDTAGLHATELGISMQTLAKNNMTWVMSGLHFEVFNLPTINSFVDIHTKISNCTKISSQRDFFITCNGEKIANVSSEWLIINTKTRRPVFLNEVFPDVFDLTSEDEISVEKYKHLRFVLDDDKYQSVNKIKYSDIDINKHLYSMRYLEMTFDLFDIDFFKSKKIKRMDVNFLSEVLYNQEVKIYKQQNENISQIEMRYEGKTMYRAEFETSEPTNTL